MSNAVLSTAVGVPADDYEYVDENDPRLELIRCFLCVCDVSFDKRTHHIPLPVTVHWASSDLVRTQTTLKIMVDVSEVFEVSNAHHENI